VVVVFPLVVVRVPVPVPVLPVRVLVLPEPEPEPDPEPDVLEVRFRAVDVCPEVWYVVPKTSGFRDAL